MKPETGEVNYTTIWNALPRKRLKQIHDFIKYEKLEPLSAEKLIDELITFGDKLSETPKAYRVIKELSNSKFEYRTANYKKMYRFIYRLNEKKNHLIITNIFHNKRDPRKLRKY